MIGGVTVGQHTFRVHVVPGSKRFQLVGWDHWRKALIIKLKNPAEGGKANKELVDNLSSIINHPVSILRGVTTRDKVLSVECDDLEFQKILRKLGIYEED